MNTSPLCERTNSRNRKFPLLVLLVLAGALSILCFGVGSLLLQGETAARNTRTMPAGQLQADARSVVAALFYVLEPDSDIEIDPVAFSGNRAEDTLPAPNWRLETFASSNQVALRSGPSTNRPGGS